MVPTSVRLAGRFARPHFLILAAGMLLLAWLPGGAFPVHAAGTYQYTVNSTLDAPAANPSNTVCETAPGNGQCTLRAVIDIVNHLAPGSVVTIVLPPGRYLLTLG